MDILVNNAGITRDRTIGKMTYTEWKEVIDTNLNGAFLCTREALDYLKGDGGRIINISSVIGQMGNFGQSNYSASKAGLIGLTKSSALEFAKFGITVNAVAPGFIETDMTNKIPLGIREELINKIPLKRMGKPHEVAKLVSFLASEHSGYITGQVFGINGGLY
jgi:NAD(P)-dependent dehydrogenase (short-subunit alcohol dehydrogenase family)